MSFAAIFYRLGWLLVIMAVGMLSPAIFASVGGEDQAAFAFGAAVMAAAFCGIGLILSLRDHRAGGDMPVVLMFLTLAWAVVPFFGAVPLYVSGTFTAFTDAYFEALSALTTTGATLMTDLEAAPRSVLVWRSVMQWLGGLGSLVVASEVASIMFWKGVPLTNVPLARSRHETAMGRLGPALIVILPIYGYLTGVTFFGLWSSGIPVFDSLCLSLSAISTGGMMPRSDGLDSYQAPLAPFILMIAMAASAMNIMVHRNAARGRFKSYRQDHEVRHYAVVLVTAIALVLVTGTVTSLSGTGAMPDWAALVFFAVSFATTTGFVWQDQAIGQTVSPILMMALVAVGGSVLSTAGGFRVLRAALLIKHAVRELRRLAHPHGVARLTYGDIRIADNILEMIGALFLAVIISVSALTIAVAATGVSFEDAFIATAAAISNTGPLYHLVAGPTAWRDLPEAARAVLSLAMVLGRLEVLIILGVLNPFYWRRA